MPNQRIRIVVEIALTVALAAVLNVYKLTLPWNFAGGSISLAMLPLFVLALRRGAPIGILAGVLFGTVDYFYEPWFVHPAQVILDYGVAFGACGLAGLVRSGGTSASSTHSSFARVVLGSLIGGTGRFTAAYLSGIIFFSANAPKGQPVWIYSAVYNASYLLPSVIACAAAATLVIPALERAVPTAPRMRGQL